MGFDGSEVLRNTFLVHDCLLSLPLHILDRLNGFALKLRAPSPWAQGGQRFTTYDQCGRTKAMVPSALVSFKRWLGGMLTLVARPDIRR